MTIRVIIACLLCTLCSAEPVADSCAASPEGCTRNVEFTDLNTLMQSRVRVGALTQDAGAKVSENKPLEEKGFEEMLIEDPLPPDDAKDEASDEAAVEDLGDVNVDVDHLGLLESDGDEPVEHDDDEDDEDLGFEELQEDEEGTDGGGSPVDPADDPILAPYLEDLIQHEQLTEFLEQQEQDDDEDDGEEDEEEDDRIKRAASEQAEQMTDITEMEVEAKEQIRKHPRLHRDDETQHAFEDDDIDDLGLMDVEEKVGFNIEKLGLITAAEEIGGAAFEQAKSAMPTPCGGTLKCERYAMNVQCKARLTDMGTFKTLQACAQAVYKEKSHSFIFGKGGSMGKCYKVDTKVRYCPEGFKKDVGYDFYFVADYASPAIYSVFPAAGSINGGTIITIEGHGLYEAHDKMDQTGATASSLMPSIEIYFVHVQSGFKMKCPMDNFESREDSVKCITPSVSKMRNLTNLPMDILLFKRVGKALVPAQRLGSTKALQYTFSTGATPTLTKVTPQAAGTGEVITMMAWSCSGIVEAEPVLLVPNKPNLTNATSAKTGANATTPTGVVDDPADGWGHVCDPFPAIADRQRHAVSKNDIDAKATSEERSMRGAKGVELGAPGLNLVFYELTSQQKKDYPVMDSQDKIQKFLDAFPVTKGRRAIVPRPYLAYGTFWNKPQPGQEKAYVAFLDGFVKIMTKGPYEFRMNCMDAGFIKVGADLLKDVRRRRRPTAGWGHWRELYSDKVTIDRGWEKISIAHYVRAANPSHSALEIRYKGPDTQHRWEIIPKANLRAGIWIEDLKGYELGVPKGENTKYLTPAKEIPQIKKPIGMARCPGGSWAKMVIWSCTVSKDMKPGFYNVEFSDHRFGEGSYEPAQFGIGMGKEKANVRIVPVVDSVTMYDKGKKMMVKGKGLDSLQHGPYQFEKSSFRFINGTQDHLELEKVGEYSFLTPTVIGARGILREMWMGRNAWPDVMESKFQQKPSWQRASALKTKIEQSKYVAGTGFSERLSGLFTPPFSGSCRWRMQGTQLHSSYTANEGRLYVSDTPTDGNLASVPSSTVPDPPRVDALFRYAGADLSGTPEDLSDWFPKTPLGGSVSFAFTVRFDKRNSWSTVFQAAKDHVHRDGLSCCMEGSSGNLLCREYPSRQSVRARNVIVLGKDIEVLWTLSDKRQSQLFVNSLLAATHTRMGVPVKKIRSDFKLGTNRFDGEITNFQVYDKVVSWYDAFGKPKVSVGSVYGEMIKPDMMQNHVRFHYMGIKTSVSECAEAVSKKTSYNSVFLFGKNHRLMMCYQVHAQPGNVAPHGFRFDFSWDVYLVKTFTVPAQPAITYPTLPIVKTSAAHERSSKYFDYTAGKSYPFKLERRVAARSQSTGIDGWKKLGLECKTLSGVGNTLLPKPTYLVSMKLHRYPLALKLPKSQTSYKVSFKGKEATVQDDATAGRALLSVFGPTCNWPNPGKIKLVDFEKISQKMMPNPEAYCGIGAATALTKPDGSWWNNDLGLASPSEIGGILLRDYPWLHMCIKIEPKAVVNMVVTAQVGTRRRRNGHTQQFSVLLTDTRGFHRDRAHAAIFTNNLKIVNGTTTGQWDCGSINLMTHVRSWQQTKKRFWGINYRMGPLGTGPGSPDYELAQMKIVSIMLSPGYHKHGRYERLGGKVSVDMLALSEKQISVTQVAPAPLLQLPFKVIEDADIGGVGWKVEWFSHYRSFLGKPNFKAKTADVVTFHKRIELHNCRAAWTTRRCDHYGWRATGTIHIQSSGSYKFYYSNDDDMFIFVDGVSSGHLRCCNRWGYTAHTKVFNLKAGTHKVEVHFWQGGGGNFGAMRWSKDGKNFFYETAPKPGISKDHYVNFFPTKRADFSTLKTWLSKEFQVNGAAAVVSEPKGYPPADDVVVTLAPPKSQKSWKFAVLQDRKNSVPDKDIGEATFNAAFKKCPVVRYARDGSTYAIYVRDSAIPANFNAYKLFTENWGESRYGANSNTLKKDMNIYSKSDDVNNAGKRWRYSYYDGTGFPGRSGPTHRRDHYSFRMKANGGVMGAFVATLELWDGANCPSKFGTSGSGAMGLSATFSMSDSDVEIMNKIKKAGLPSTSVAITNRNGLVRMKLINPVQTSDHHRNMGAEKAIDGNPSCNAGRGACSHTKRENSPWWRADVADTKGNVVDVDILQVRVKSSSDGSSGRLSGFDLYVDGVNGRVKCASSVFINQGAAVDVTCVATGSSIMVVLPKNEYLVICEVEVYVADTTVGKISKEYDRLEIKVTSEKRGSQRKLLFSSALAESSKITTLSNGERFFPDITDFWFRMPHTKNQVLFGTEFDAYVASDSSGTAPVATNKNLSAPHPNHPMSLFQRSHNALGEVSHLKRREPHRRWRLPARYHTEETLEAMSRRVLGLADSPKGWAESSSLLELHADHEYHARVKKGELDPRDDPNALRWSDPKSWGGEKPPTGHTADIIYFPAGKTGMLDMHVAIRFWVLEGHLIWDMNKDIVMGAEAIVVNGGSFLVGKESAPFTKYGHLLLQGHWHTFKLPLCGVKTIFETMGVVEMHGQPVKHTWTDLAETIPAGGTVIKVRDPVHDWKPGDLMVIASTDKPVYDCRLDRRDDCQVEERYVRNVSADGLSITLDRYVVYRHAGEELEPYVSHRPWCQTHDKSYDPKLCLKTQVRAEVGLMTRNLKVSGSNYDDGTGPAGSEGYGGHLMHAERARYTYVEMWWMGQAFQLGRYPLHLHLTGLNPWSKFVGCSLRRSFNRGVTVHGTHGALVQDNVLYNHMSHGFFIEDGNEHDNIFEHNLGMMTHTSFSMLVSDQTPATFWIRNPSQYFRNNHAAGSASFGFWFDILGAAAPLVIHQFVNNTAHSNKGTGIWIDKIDALDGCFAPNDWVIGVPRSAGSGIDRPRSENAPSCGGKQRVTTPFVSTTTYSNAAFGIVFNEGGHINFINTRALDTTLIWGVGSEVWPDVTNNFNGPTIMKSVFHGRTQSAVPMKMGTSIGLPWDDTLFITSTNFIGGGTSMRPCMMCLAQEGGYEIRTSELGWYEGAGTPSIPKVSFPWKFVTFFFDMDGTLTEQSPSCKAQGCYLIPRMGGGMYKRMITTSTTTTGATTVGPPTNTTGPPGPASSFFGKAPLNLVGTERTGVMRCLQSLVGSASSKKLADSGITSSPSYYPTSKSRLNEKGRVWCTRRNDNNQYLSYKFDEPKWITAVHTQGNPHSDQWVTFYKLKCKANATSPWKTYPGTNVLEGNQNRNSVWENLLIPAKCKEVRIEVEQWHRHICMRADILGCSGTKNLTKVCMNKPYLNMKQEDCRKLERKLGAGGMKRYCKKMGHKFMFTLLSANQACCACGGGETYFTAPEGNTTKKMQQKSAMISVPGGTSYAPPTLCHLVDSTGGMVCQRPARHQSITIKSAGVWHKSMPIQVQTRWGWSTMIFALCYQQYEFSVFQNERHMIVPPFTPKKLVDWDSFSAVAKMRAGDVYVLQWETIHNPDGYSVSMAGQTKRAYCIYAPIIYGNKFYNNTAYLNEVARDRNKYAASRLGLDLKLDMYKVAHYPLLDTKNDKNSAANWGYIQANTSYTMKYWYPGSFQFIMTGQGVHYGSNPHGPWNGKRANINEVMPTRPFNHGYNSAQIGGFSHAEIPMSWNRFDAIPPPPNKVPINRKAFTRLEYIYKFCHFEPASFAFSDQFAGTADALRTLAKHPSVNDSNVTVGPVLTFKWSQWPNASGGKPTTLPAPYSDQGVGNVTIEFNWEVTLDEDVDFINKLNISGVLKFEDKPGCCKLVARYIFVGPWMGRLEAGTVGNPFVNGKAHIILKGHPLTPKVKTWFPHLASSAKWLHVKFIAVQGTLNLYGKPRTRIWTKLAQSAPKGATQLMLAPGAEFHVGDQIALNSGAEIMTVVKVAGNVITVDHPLDNAYKGLDHIHMGETRTTGLMTASVGMVGGNYSANPLSGHTVVVEGEDTPGIPMCDRSVNHTCPWNGLPGGTSLHDFAKDLRYWEKKTGRAAHPSCRPCLAVSEQNFPGYIIAMAYFDRVDKNCPKDHGVIHASNVEFRHASNIHPYYPYAGHGGTSVFEGFPGKWSSFRHEWWSDPVWKELKTPAPGKKEHLFENSAFNNSIVGNAVAIVTSGVLTVNMAPVKGNTFLVGGVGVNGACVLIPPKDFSDRMLTITMGVGPPGGSNAGKDWGDYHGFLFEDNMILGVKGFNVFHGSRVRNNMIYGTTVKLQGTDISSKTSNTFTDNIISESGRCLEVRYAKGTKGIADNVAHSCGICVGFSNINWDHGLVTRMTMINCGLGIYYFVAGPSAMAHDTHHAEFKVTDSTFYSRANGGGKALMKPKIHAVQLGEPGPPDWWAAGPRAKNSKSSPSLYFRSKLDGLTFIGYNSKNGGLVLEVGGGRGSTSDEDYYPVLLRNMKFKNVDRNAYLRFLKPWGAGMGVKQCIQFDCDGLKNALVIDEDGSLIGKDGTVIPEPHKFYDKLNYVDPLGFDTMEDLIPFPARYDRFGDAIPFPLPGGDVKPGTCGGLEYNCTNKGGCDVLFMNKGWWKPRAHVPKIPEGGRVVATREDGGLIRLDPIHHGWIYATGWVRTKECVITQNYRTCKKPNAQHARRYGRVAPGHFGTHINTSRVRATIGPVYTQPGIWRQGCKHNPSWRAWECTGKYKNHRHLLIEVMDWNHCTRRWAPVTVEVNDNYDAQGGTMNILTGPAMYKGGLRLQTFHALGHVGLRHNVYFMGDPPTHIRLHLQWAKKSEAIVACVYYGLPNMIVGYVNNKLYPTNNKWIPTWDNLVFTKLYPTMPHGTHYYDRVGVETGRPGYLYAVIGGEQYIDFKISHKVVLSTKITVNAIWGSWKSGHKNNSNSFFKQGLDGLVRNLVLLIGCPPSRVKILGNGSAKPGTFWNRKTTSNDAFAKWIWKQNQSMDRMKMKKWRKAPGAKLKNSSHSKNYSIDLLESSGDLMNADAQTASFLSQFAKHRHDVVRGALDAGEDWYRTHSSLLTDQEAEAIQERLFTNELYRHGENHEAVLAEMQQTANDPANGEIELILDEDTANMPPPSSTSTKAEAQDQGALELDGYNKGELKIENGFAAPIAQMFAGGKNFTTNASGGVNTTQVIKKLEVDSVPTKFNPLAWTCNFTKWGDGFCDCDCGAWDPDCDKAAYGHSTYSVAIFNNGSRSYLLADYKHVTAIMNWLDADGNANGLLDGNEITKIDSLGASALHGLATKIEYAERANKGRGDDAISWKGNFANRAKAVATSSCNHELSNRQYTDAIATETPVCVKDIYWDKILKNPTGHCALLPRMKQGSQCVIPGEGAPYQDGTPYSSNLTGSALVCSQIFKVFPGATGTGAGGILGTNAGVTSAKLFHEGGTFVPGNTKYVMHKLDLLPPKKGFTNFLGGNGFSLYFKLNAHDWAHGGTIFQLCTDTIDGRDKPKGDCQPKTWRGRRHGSYCGSKHCRYCWRLEPWCGPHRRQTGHVTCNSISMLLHMRGSWDRGDERHGKIHWYAQRSNYRNYASIPVVAGEDEEILAVAKGTQIMLQKKSSSGGITTSKGKIDYWDNAKKCGATKATKKLTIGHGLYGSADADITNIRFWPHEVDMSAAAAGHIPGKPAKPASQNAKATVNMKCIPSKKNSWDFVCADVIPDHLSIPFGYGSPITRKVRREFELKKTFGTVAQCPTNFLGAKAIVYKGHFGDGLVGEYFQMINDAEFTCNTRPFVFGVYPRVTRLDTKLTYNTSLAGKSCPAVSYNDLVVRWSGNLLISQGGPYQFEVGVDDAVWLAIDSNKVIDGMRSWQEKISDRRRTRVTTASRSQWCDKYKLVKGTGSMKLTKGSHTIAILYANYAKMRGHHRHPPRMIQNSQGAFDIMYSGLDTGGKMQPIPAKALGANPSKRKQIGKKTQGNTTLAVMIGQFVWDEQRRMAVMPQGSCPFDCRRGRMKTAAATFKFFCKSDATVSFKAEVNVKAERALMWLDNAASSQNWDMTATSLVQHQEAEAGEGEEDQMRAQMADQLRAQMIKGNLTDDYIVDLSLGLIDIGAAPTRTSPTSPELKVHAGEHFVYFQGTPTDSSFAFKSISFVKGFDMCKFFLQGKDKAPTDCFT